MKNEDILKENGGKKFDVVLMNPPYDRGLYMDFLKKVSEIANNTISVQPINKFQQAKLSNKDFPLEITNIDIIDNANEQFNLSFKYNVGIVTIKEKNKTKESKNIEALLYESIYKKIKNKTKYFLNKKIEKLPSTKYSIRFPVGTGFDPEHNYDWVSRNYNYAIKQEKRGHTGFISMNSEEEQKNLYNYSQTHFFKFCVIIGSDKLVPWMEDYTINWTDEKLYKYFNLSEDDIKIINKETEYYFNKKKNNE